MKSNREYETRLNRIVKEAAQFIDIQLPDHLIIIPEVGIAV